MAISEKATRRRRFLKSLIGSAITIAGACVGRPLLAASTSGVTAGAIRWDAWYKRLDDSAAAQDNLSSPKYSSRAPFFCNVDSTHKVTCGGDMAEMELEIKAANDGGLSYWAFVRYNTNSSLSAAWDLYMQCPSRNLINWCGIISPSNLGSLPFSNNKWRSNVLEWAGHMEQPHYQKVTAQRPGRPLLYLLWSDSQVKNFFDGDLANVAKCLSFLRETLEGRNTGPPYVVLLDAVVGAPIARKIGADAISNYIPGFQTKKRGSYVDLDEQARQFWKDMAATGASIVPDAIVGWDTRARQEHPVPWDKRPPIANPTEYYDLATPRELAAHVGAAVKYVEDNPTVCPAQTILIYSWDECDEGGGLIPTLGDKNGSYLHAIAPILLSARSASAGSPRRLSITQ